MEGMEGKGFLGGTNSSTEVYSMLRQSFLHKRLLSILLLVASSNIPAGQHEPGHVYFYILRNRDMMHKSPRQL